MTTQVMTPSQNMTEGQVNKAVAHYRDMLEKHRGEFGTSEDVQQMLGSPEYLAEQLAIIRKRVQEISKGIVHVVKVDRKRSPHEALEASGRRLYVTNSVIETMPRGTGEKVKLVYFKPDPSVYEDGVLSCQALADEYKRRGLRPDPQAQIDDNAANPEFGDTTLNACQWVDANGKYCYATFCRWGGARGVRVDRHDHGWVDCWAFAGVPQESSASAV